VSEENTQETTTESSTDTGAENGSEDSNSTSEESSVDSEGEGDSESNSDDGQNEGDENSEEESEGSAIDADSLSVPEGFEVDSDMMDKFLPIINDSGISQEKAQELMTIHADAITKMVQNDAFREGIHSEVQAKRIDAWADATLKGADFGGVEQSKEAVATAITAIEALKIPELTALVKDPELGIGNNAKFIKFFDKIGQMVKEHGFETSGESVNNSEVRDHEVMYPNKSE